MSNELKQTWEIAHSYVALVWSHRYVAIVFAVLVAAIGFTLVFFLPDRYRSEARVYVDTESMLSRSLTGLVVDSTASSREIVQVARSTLLGRPVIDSIIREYDLDHKATTPESYARLVEDIKDGIWIDVELTTGNRESIFSVSFLSDTPEFSYQMTNALLNAFSEAVMGSKLRETEATLRFLGDRTGEYKRRLEEAENKLKEFKSANAISAPQQGERDYFAQVHQAEVALNDARLLQNQLIRQRNELSSQIQTIIQEGAREGQPNQANPLVVQLNELQRRREDLLLSVTERHPDVAAIDYRIEQLRKEVDLLEFESAQAAAEGNPIVEELSVELARIEAEAAFEAERVEEYERRLRSLQVAAESQPVIEAELAKLTRDYSVTREQYEELLRRQESAALSKEREEASHADLFNVIEPPIVPALPEGRSKFLLASLVLVIALGGGVTLSLGIGMLNSGVMSASVLQQSFPNIPMLGVVSVQQLDGQTGYVEYLGYALVVSLLIGGYVFVVAHSMHLLPL